MNEVAEEQTGTEYPEDLDKGTEAYSKNDKDLKIEAGSTVRLKVISGPLVYQEGWFDLPDRDEKTGKPKRLRVALPLGQQLPGYDLKTKSLIEVVMLNGSTKGQHKLFTFGKQVHDGLAKIKRDWGSTRTPDVIIDRVGASKNDTRYTATGGPSTVDSNTFKPQFDLQKEVRFSKAEDLAKLPPPVTGRVEKDVLTTAMSSKQYELISSLADAKDMSLEEVEKHIRRKFNDEKMTIQDLNGGQASQIIDLLKQF